MEEKEIVELEREWWRIADSRLCKVSLDKFRTLVSPPVPQALVAGKLMKLKIRKVMKHPCFEGLFQAFDENCDNQMDFKELVCGLSACCRGPIVDRRKCIFLFFFLSSPFFH